MPCTGCKSTLLFPNRARNSLSISVYWSHWGRSSLQKSYEIKIGISGERNFLLPFCFTRVKKFLPLLTYTQVMQFICVAGEVYRNTGISYWMAHNLQVISINVLNLEAKLNLLSGRPIHKHKSYFWKRFIKVKVLKILWQFCSQHF